MGNEQSAPPFQIGDRVAKRGHTEWYGTIVGQPRSGAWTIQLRDRDERQTFRTHQLRKLASTGVMIVGGDGAPAGYPQNAGYGRPSGALPVASGYPPNAGYPVAPPTSSVPPAGYPQGAGYAPPPAGYPQGAGYAPPPAGYPQGAGYAPPPVGYPQGAGYAPPPAGYPQGAGYAPSPAGYPQGAGYAPPPAGYPQGAGYAPPPSGVPPPSGGYPSAPPSGEDEVPPAYSQS